MMKVRGRTHTDQRDTHPIHNRHVTIHEHKAVGEEGVCDSVERCPPVLYQVYNRAHAAQEALCNDAVYAYVIGNHCAYGKVVHMRESTRSESRKGSAAPLTDSHASK